MAQDTITIYHNARCSNSRGALALMEARGIEPRIVDYLRAPLDSAQLAALIAQLGLPTVIVQEGGYLSEDLGLNLESALRGFETGAG